MWKQINGIHHCGSFDYYLSLLPRLSVWAEPGVESKPTQYRWPSIGCQVSFNCCSASCLPELLEEADDYANDQFSTIHNVLECHVLIQTFLWVFHNVGLVVEVGVVIILL